MDEVSAIPGNYRVVQSAIMHLVPGGSHYPGASEKEKPPRVTDLPSFISLRSLFRSVIVDSTPQLS